MCDTVSLRHTQAPIDRYHLTGPPARCGVCQVHNPGRYFLRSASSSQWHALGLLFFDVCNDCVLHLAGTTAAQVCFAGDTRITGQETC